MLQALQGATLLAAAETEVERELPYGLDPWVVGVGAFVVLVVLLFVTLSFNKR